MKKRSHPVPKVGDTVALNREGLIQIFGTSTGLSHMLSKRMKVTRVGTESLTEPQETFEVEVDDPEINKFLIDHWCFDIVEPGTRAAGPEDLKVYEGIAKGYEKPPEDDSPSIAEELNRKALETLENAVRQFEAGQITRAQFDARIDGIWGTCAGLVSKPISDAISAAHSGGSISSMTRVAFKDEKGESVLILEWATDTAKCRVIRIDATRIADSVKDFGHGEPATLARDRIAECARTFLKMGYRPL